MNPWYQRHINLRVCRDSLKPFVVYINSVGYLKIIQRVCIGYEWAIIISYPTRASGIIVLLKNVEKISRTDFQLVFNFEQTRTVTIFGGHGIIVISKIQLAVYYQCCVLIG